MNALSEVIVGRWGKSLAVRVPLEVARAAGLRDGEPVEIEAVDGDIVIRRRDGQAAAQRDARTAADEIRSAAAAHRLDGLSISALREEGRR